MSDIEPFFGEHQRALLPSRVAEKIGPVDPDTGCWPWLASTNNGGYGRVRWFGRKAFAHRLVFHLLADPSLVVWPGLGSNQPVDHLCRNKVCVKPSHLRVTTTRVNTCAGLVGALGANRQTSRFLGVSWCRSSHGWKASIRIDHVRRYLGLFDDETEAARAYDDAREAVDDVRPNGTKR